MEIAPELMCWHAGCRWGTRAGGDGVWSSAGSCLQRYHSQITKWRYVLTFLLFSSYWSSWWVLQSIRLRQLRPSQFREMTTSVTASPHFRSSASSHGPSADDCVRWLHHQHGATDQPEAQTAELNFCMRAGVFVGMVCITMKKLQWMEGKIKKCAVLL